MALTADSNLQNNKTIYYQGIPAKIVFVDTNTVTIECNGRCFPVDRSKLATMPLFVYNLEQIERNNNLIAELKQKAEDYTLAKRNYREDSRDYLAKVWNNCKEWGVSRYEKLVGEKYAIQESLREQHWSARIKAVAAHNREYNCLRIIQDLVSANGRIQA